MLDFSRTIIRLRKISFLLFIIPTIGLLGSLVFNNILAEFNFKPGQSYNSINLNTISDDKKLTINCNEDNNFCENINFDILKTLDSCHAYDLKRTVIVNNTRYEIEKYIEFFFEITNQIKFKEEYKNYKIQNVYERRDKLRGDCIVNSKLYKIYKLVPQPFELIHNLISHKNYLSGTSGAVYPFLFGEASISNIVKRFPINFVFKPLLFFTSILMLFYWLNYQIIFNHLTNNKHTYKFFIFGVSSAFFLFFHILFLGMDVENEYFKTLRRIIIILFILFELAAQFFLVRRIIIIKDQLEKFTNKNIINAKIIFITIILIISFIIVGILATYDLPKKVDYFLEWDYFLILLFFYLLSSIMWRKN